MRLGGGEGRKGQHNPKLIILKENLKENTTALFVKINAIETPARATVHEALHQKYLHSVKNPKHVQKMSKK